MRFKHPGCSVVLARVLMFATLIFSARAHAFIDVEALRMKLRDQPYGGVGTLSWDRREGNTDVNHFSTGAFGLWKINDIESLLTFERDWGDSNGAEDTDSTTGHARVTWPVSQPSAIEAYWQIEHDGFRRLSDRELWGLGLRQRIVNTKTFFLFLGAGPMFSRETVNGQIGTTDAGSSQLWRWDFYLSLRHEVAQHIAFNFVTYYQPSSIALADLRLNNDSDLELEVNEWLSVSLIYQLVWESRPPQTILPVDQHFQTTLKFKF